MRAEEDICGYWDRVWVDRIIDDNTVEMNQRKMEIVVDTILSRPYLHWGRKLEVGCGAGVHAIHISEYIPQFLDGWHGIELANSAVRFGLDRGLRVDKHDISVELPKTWGPYRVFFFLDCLEHLKQPGLAAENIKKNATKEYYVFGNVPLYRSEHEKEGGFERDVNLQVVGEFLLKSGCVKFDQHVYGVNGFPYMLFEGFSDENMRILPFGGH